MFELKKIDLYSKENLYLLPPGLESLRAKQLRQELEAIELDSHIFILSSGSTSTGELKGYALSKDAIAANAAAVNRHLSLGANDHWLLSLPHWHIGGLSVYARAALAGSKVLHYEGKWEPSNWAKSLDGVAVTSIVPLQAYDIVAKKLRPPQGFKFLIVGGDLLSSSLHQALFDLGWPVLRTFGMTEVCSQLATERAPSQRPNLELLDIHEIKVGDDKLLQVKTPSLFTGVFKCGQSFHYEKAQAEEGFFRTSDLAQWDGKRFVHLGRADQAFKAKGRLFYLNELRDLLASYAFENGFYGKLELVLLEDEREGRRGRIIALKELENLEAKLRKDLKELLYPLSWEGPDFVESINRTDLGKLKKN